MTAAAIIPPPPNGGDKGTVAFHFRAARPPTAVRLSTDERCSSIDFESPVFRGRADVCTAPLSKFSHVCGRRAEGKEDRRSALAGLLGDHFQAVSAGRRSQRHDAGDG